jgi:hypothetical protein
MSTETSNNSAVRDMKPRMKDVLNTVFSLNGLGSTKKVGSIWILPTF